MRKGWRAGLFGWDPSSWTGGLMRRGWEDVTPHVELKTTSTTSTKLTYSGDDIVVTPNKGFVKEVGTYDLDKEQVNNGGNAAKVVDTKGFTEVTHVSVHVPVDKTPDGFYRFVVCDDRNKVCFLLCLPFLPLCSRKPYEKRILLIVLDVKSMLRYEK